MRPVVMVASYAIDGMSFMVSGKSFTDVDPKIRTRWFFTYAA